MNSNMISIIIAICYLAFKIAETRFITKDDKPLKVILRDSLIVYIAGLCGFFVFSQIEPITDNIKSTPNVFVNDPDF
jgi:hypothetical protein